MGRRPEYGSMESSSIFETLRPVSNSNPTIAEDGDSVSVFVHLQYPKKSHCR